MTAKVQQTFWILQPVLAQQTQTVIPAKAGIHITNPWKDMKAGYVYILTNKRNGTLYTGVTSNLVQRVWQHKNHVVKGFTQKYNTNSLVYFEQHLDITEAIQREKQIKAWKRQWKIELIEKDNPNWLDQYPLISK